MRLICGTRIYSKPKVYYYKSCKVPNEKYYLSYIMKFRDNKEQMNDGTSVWDIQSMFTSIMQLFKILFIVF